MLNTVEQSKYCNDELGGTKKKLTAAVQFNVIFQYFPQGTEKTTENSSQVIIIQDRKPNLGPPVHEVLKNDICLPHIYRL